MTLKLNPQFQTAYQQLNPAQKKAVDLIEGPVMVVAGPGTGKTQVLSVRIARILQQTDTPPEAVLALTFTESGAKAMRQRLLEMIGPASYYVSINTFHAFAALVINTYPAEFEITSQAQVLSDLEKVEIISQILQTHQFRYIKPPARPEMYVKALLKAIQDLKREAISVSDFTQLLQQVELEEKQAARLQEVSQVYQAYQTELTKRQRYDYEDMINLVLQQFEHNHDLLRQLQERYLYFLADEYQDTNTAQNQLLFKLAEFWGDQANIFVVGDPDQSIYRFQGATMENVLSFRQHYPTAEIIYLNYNYRSQQTVLDAAYSLIQHNQVKSQDLLDDWQTGALQSQTEWQADKLKLARLPSEVVEAAFVGDQIKRLLAQGVPANQIAVVYRDNADADFLGDILARMGIAYNLEGGIDVLTAADVNKLLRVFTVIDQLKTGSEDLDLFTLLSYEFWGIEMLSLYQLARYASRKRVNFLEAINQPELTEKQVHQIDRIRQVLDQLIAWGRWDQELPLVELMERVINQSGLLQWILQQSNSVRRLNQLNSFFGWVKQLNYSNHQLDIAQLLANVRLMQQQGIKIWENDLDIDVNAVRLSTAHKVKGLEFDYVFIVKAYDGKWGNKKVRQLIKLPEQLMPLSHQLKKEKNEDERRLFYVALTRAKKQCWITFADSYQERQVVPSMFISEIDSSCLQTVDTSEFQASLSQWLPQLFQPLPQSQPSESEKEFLRSVLASFKMNPTALNTYLTCPYKFKLNQLLRTPAAKPAAMAYGTAIHKALEMALRQYQRTGKLPQLEYVTQQFLAALDKELIPQDSQAEWRERGVEALTRYWQEYSEQLPKPIFTERFFGSNFNPVYLTDIPLSGKVDKVELISADTKQVRVVDYKTGKVRSRNQIEGKTKYDDGGYKRQLVFYQILANRDRSFDYQVVETQLDFVEPNPSGKLVKHSFKITQQEVDEMEALIKHVMEQIRQLEFPRTQDYRACQRCDYFAHCWPEGLPKLNGEQLNLWQKTSQQENLED